MSRITPTTEVRIWDFGDTAKPIKLITLAAWSCGIEYSEKADQIMRFAREFLGAPDDYPDAGIILHIKDSYADVKEQMGMGRHGSA